MTLFLWGAGGLGWLEGANLGDGGESGNEREGRAARGGEREGEGEGEDKRVK